MSGESSEFKEENLTVLGGQLTMRTSGSGDPLLILHGELGFPGWMNYHQELSKRYKVMAPSHPGYDESDRLDWAMKVSDLAGAYLQLLDQIDVPNIRLMGFSMGAWLAAEMAVMDPGKFSRLVLVGPMGVKPEEGEIYDLFLNLAPDFLEESFLDPQSVKEYSVIRPDEPSAEQEELWEVGREQSARLAWKPYMYNQTLPYLLGRLKRLQTLIVAGKQDSIVPIDSFRIYNESIPGSKLSLIDQSGHRPEIENMEEFLKVTTNFLK
tara:strand:- start:6242 stop:7039 length:798 start_codon:yes stop_codon:yes gene_type:complete